MDGRHGLCLLVAWVCREELKEEKEEKGREVRLHACQYHARVSTTDNLWINAVTV